MAAFPPQFAAFSRVHQLHPRLPAERWSLSGALVGTDHRRSQCFCDDDSVLVSCRCWQPGWSLPQHHHGGGLPDDRHSLRLGGVSVRGQGCALLRRPQLWLPAAAAGVSDDAGRRGKNTSDDSETAAGNTAVNGEISRSEKGRQGVTFDLPSCSESISLEIKSPTVAMALNFNLAFVFCTVTFCMCLKKKEQLIGKILSELSVLYFSRLLL